MSKRIVALIVAAGDSNRFGGEIPKPYMELGGKTVLRHSLDTFLSHPNVETARVVISRPGHPAYKVASNGLTLFPPVIGGATRQDSVRIGLESIARIKPDYALIHDAARPLVSHALIDRVIDALEKHAAVLPAMKVVDTLKRADAEGHMETVARDELLAAQTPQGFHFASILDAHRRFQNEPVTDDIALAEKAGIAIGVVDGERNNFKITWPEDLGIMQQMNAMGVEYRTGMGTDVHAFGEHDNSVPAAQRVLTLCGVKVPFDKCLVGHSDADLGLHAVVDAILGAIGEGDIGQHFSAEDPQWAGADSSRFLIHAYQLLIEKKGSIVNIDITFMGEKPKMHNYRKQMKAQLASLLKIEESRVNIKATTTEKLGFLGRSEGLAAQAIVTVKLPEGS